MNVSPLRLTSNGFRLACLSLCVGLGVVAYAIPSTASLSFGPIYSSIPAGRIQTTGTFIVGNTGDRPIRVRLSATPFTYDEQGKFQETNGSEGFDLTPYLCLSPMEMTVPANSRRNVRFAVILPPSLPDGEYHVAVFAETLDASNISIDVNGVADYEVTPRSNIGYLFRMGSALYVRKGNVSPSLSVKPAQFSTKDHILRLPVQNQGTATARAMINWQLFRNGELISQGTGANSYLPNQTVQSQLRPEVANRLNLTAGNYDLTGEFVWQKDNHEQRQSFETTLQVGQ